MSSATKSSDGHCVSCEKVVAISKLQVNYMLVLQNICGASMAEWLGLLS